MKSFGFGVIWILVIGVVSAILGGTGVFFWVRSQDNSSTVEKRVDSLQTQIDILKKEKSANQPTQTSFPDSNNNQETDNRKLLLPNKDGTYLSIGDVGSPACSGEGAGVVSDAFPNSQVVFKSESKGLEMKIPFNSNWFSSKYKVNPYDEQDRSIGFGNLTISEGCGFHRSYGLELLPYRDEQAVISDLNNQKKNDVTWMYGPVVESINGLKVVKFTTGGLCGTAQEEIIGKKNNYSLAIFCRDDFKPLDEVVKSISLL